MYVYTYACICIYVYILYAYTYVYMYMYTCAHKYIDVYIFYIESGEFWTIWVVAFIPNTLNISACIFKEQGHYLTYLHTFLPTPNHSMMVKFRKFNIDKILTYSSHSKLTYWPSNILSSSHPSNTGSDPLLIPNHVLHLTLMSL